MMFCSCLNFDPFQKFGADTIRIATYKLQIRVRILVEIIKVRIVTISTTIFDMILQYFRTPMKIGES